MLMGKKNPELRPSMNSRTFLCSVKKYAQEGEKKAILIHFCKMRKAIANRKQTCMLKVQNHSVQRFTQQSILLISIKNKIREGKKQKGIDQEKVTKKKRYDKVRKTD